jgi:hypothetical protein
LVEPELDIIFYQGQDVILTQRTKIGFQAITLNLYINLMRDFKC